MQSPLTTEDGCDQEFKSRYQLLYSVHSSTQACAVWTQPDIAYPVGILYRAIGSPTSILFDAALRVLAYLGRHKSVGLRYESRSSPLARRGTLMLIPRHPLFLVHH